MTLSAKHTRCIFILFSSMVPMLILIISGCQKIPGADPESLTYSKLASEFTSPPDSAKPWVYWYWINDDISKEGVTKDLEAMKRVGIGAALIGNVNPDEKDGRVPILSEAWWETMVHAVEEGKRLGIDIGVFNCPGWSQSGGPWVTSDKAMRYVTYSSTIVEGPAMVEVKLDKPTLDFQDTYLLATPVSSENEFLLDLNNAKLSTTPKNLGNLSSWFDNDVTTGVPLDLSKGNQLIIDFELKEANSVQNLSIAPMGTPFKCDCTLESLEGDKYEVVKTFEFDRQNMDVNIGPIQQGELSISFPSRKSTKFRLTCSGIRRTYGSILKGSNGLGFSEIKLSSKLVLDHYVEKQLGKMYPTPQPTYASYRWDAQEEPINGKGVVDPSKVMDISNKLGDNGVLKWEVPQGKWRVQRFGMSPTGTRNTPSAPQGKGFEIDKMNDSLARFHFENFVGELIKRIPEESKDALKYIVADSYEMGSTNWTDDFAQKFQSKFGYDPVRFLPVFSGMVVESVDASERFLWDLRRIVADLVAYEYVGGLRKISNENGLKLWLENYGHWGYPSEFLMYGGQSDLVSGEFWNEGTLGDIECKAASSAAHIYGKNRVSAEAFTSSQQVFLRHPAKLRKRGDWSFTEGINHFVLHVYIHQPDDEREPGVNAWFGTEINRHNTWFEQSKAWIDYLRRSQVLLESGNYVADVCYFISEDAPIMTGERKPELSKSYSYDYINAEVILSDISVKNNKMVLPSGVAYSMLVLPPTVKMRPAVLKKLQFLVKNGVPVFGKLPEQSPSYTDYPEADDEVAALSRSLRNEKYFIEVESFDESPEQMAQKLGKALSDFGIAPDVLIPDTDEKDILWTHRNIKEGADIYFLTNQSGKPMQVEPSFRVSGKKPQLWNAVTGEIRNLPEYRVDEDRTSVPLQFEIDESWFVVFVAEDGITQNQTKNFPEFKTIQTLDDPWALQFDKRAGPGKEVVLEKLMDLSSSDNDSIKYYSGSVTYKSNFQLEQLPTQEKVFINLGDVGVMGKVKVNGVDLGTTWMAPFRLAVDVNNLKIGENSIEVTVANLWRNRLKGDMGLDEKDRSTWFLVSDVKEDEELPTSGLIGPVTIEAQ
ncbi:glycosyl hydrolase [Flagellimonas amoyensis]|uniref:glycosyl hydrolase n=1 Tax=Flagellimonas amoyensis TaxID=2169401 RepID=UPI000D3D685C|nr:glycosyl hydrolase [Allomuricauda amoyensis]